MTEPTPSAKFAEPKDLEVRLAREFSTSERLQVQAFIEDISALIRVKRPLIDSALASGRVTKPILVALISQVAARIISSAARGAGVKSEQYPEWSYALTDAASRGLFFTADELEMLNGAAAPATAGAYSIPLYR